MSPATGPDRSERCGGVDRNFGVGSVKIKVRVYVTVLDQVTSEFI